MNEVSFAVLGPVEIAADGAAVRFTAQRQAIVLTVLLLRAGRYVSVEDLIDAVWGEAPPSTSRGQIQICVSRLRRDLQDIAGDKLIHTRPGGYLLQLTENCRLDAKRFEDGVREAGEQAARGRTAEAAAGMREALALWRGPVLPGASGKATLLAASLEEKRVSVLENCIEHELALGRHRELISELVELVAEHPMRERLRGYLMVALHRSGRQADALEVYRQARREFIEELGIEPSGSLRELEASILTGDEPQAPPEPEETEQAETLPRQLPADIGDFTGRDLAVAAAERELGPASESQAPNAMRILCISGRGGIGKTTLAVHVAHRLRADYPDGQLFACLHANGAQPADIAEILRRFLRATGLPPAALPTDLDELRDLYRSRLSGKRVIVVLDDAASERDLASLLPGSPTCSVVITSRRSLGNVPGARKLDLDVLDCEHAVTLLAQLVGHERATAEPDSLRELVEVCGRWPLALRIVGARLAARPHWALSTMVARLCDEQRRLDELAYDDLQLRSTLLISYDGLSAPAQRLFRLLSLCGAADFAEWVAAALLDTDCIRAGDLIEELVEARLLDVISVPGTMPRYGFHDLVRIFAKEELSRDDSGEQREAVHRLLGAYLALAREAHRKSYGGDFTALHGAGEVWELPEPETRRILGDPISWLEAERSGLVAAVRLAAETGADEVCWDLAVTSVTLFEARGDRGNWRETHELALEAVRRAGNRRGEAAILCSLGSLEQAASGGAELEKALRLFEELDDRHGRALTLRNLGFFDRVAGRFDSATRRYEQAITGFREVGDPVAQAHALVNLAQVHIDLFGFEQADTMLRESLELCRAAGNQRVEAQAWQRLGDLYLKQDRLEAAQEAFARVLDLVEQAEDRVGEVFALCGLGVAYTRRQELTEAERVLRRALEICDAAGTRLGEARVRLALGWLHTARHELDAADEYLQQAANVFDQLRATLWHARALDGLAGVRVLGEQPQAAEALWTKAADLLEQTGSPEAATMRSRLSRTSH